MLKFYLRKSLFTRSIIYHVFKNDDFLVVFDDLSIIPVSLVMTQEDLTVVYTLIGLITDAQRPSIYAKYDHFIQVLWFVYYIYQHVKFDTRRLITFQPNQGP